MIKERLLFVPRIFMSLLLFIVHKVLFIFRIIDNYVFCYGFSGNLNKIKKKRHYAVLVLGTGLIESSSLGLSLYKIHKSAYKGLLDRGYSRDNIIVLSCTNKKGFRPCFENLKRTLKFISKNSDKKSSFVFHFIGHGSVINNESTMLIGVRDVLVSDIYPLIDNIKGKKILIFDQCHSGGFYYSFKDMKNTIVLASTEKEYMASNNIDVEIEFWRLIGNGIGVRKAYKSAAKREARKPALWKRILIRMFFMKIGDFYLVSESDIDMPRLNKK